MLRFVAASAIIAAAAGDAAVDPKLAKILKEQRFNAGDGRTGAAYATENGQIFREESDDAGNRIGQYSYVGDDGKTYTVKYSAGVDGFRILSGDHVPSSGLDAAAYNAELDEEILDEAPLPAAPQQNAGPAVRLPNFPARPRNNAPIPVRAPQPQRQPAPLPQQPLPVQPQPFSAPLEAERPKGNPFVNPHDPTHRNFQFNKNAATFDPENPQVRQQSLVPNCADCEGVNPFVNPFDNSHQASSNAILAGHLAGLGAGVPQPPRPAPRRPAPAVPVPRPAATRPLPAPRVVAGPQRTVQTLTPTPTPTPAPRNFFPPGELKLNRFETGFNFDFSS